MADENVNAVSDDSVSGQTEEDIHILKKVRLEKLESLKERGMNPYEQTRFDYDSKNAEIRERYVPYEEDLLARSGGDAEALKSLMAENPMNVKIAGRIMTWRNMGKANFIDVRDNTDRMQVYIRMNDIGEEEFKEFKTWDIGDIVGVEGFVFRTRTGEVTVHAKKIILLSKSLLPLPEKWHGLKDQDMRYRQRYLDLICNPDVKDTFLKRSRILSEVRHFLDSRGYLEVDTPVLHTLEIGAAARPFKTHHNALDLDMYLRIPPF